MPTTCDEAQGVVGCCGPNDTVYFCGQNGLVAQKCAPGTCGWRPDKSWYDCDTTGQADPAGAYEQVCQAPAGTGGAGGSGGASGAGGSPTGPTNGAIDLRADVNRDGKVDLNDPGDDANEETWDTTHGAVFLANIDDDQGTCPKTGTDVQLAKCNDAADEVVNGADDALDLAPMRTRGWAEAPAGAVGQIWVSAPGYVRVFKKVGGSYVVVDPSKADALTNAEVKAGVELAIEGRDVVRDKAVWDGTVDVVYAVSAGGNVVGTDKVRLRVAPVITRHHLDPALEIYASLTSTAAPSALFRADLAAAAKAAGIAAPVDELATKDQWTQDFFETAYMSMPTAGGGQRVIDVYIRSANVQAPNDPNNPLRPSGKLVFTHFRGKDRAGLQHYTTKHTQGADTTNSFGNLETVPPYTLGSKSYPLGRIVRGSVPGFDIDSAFKRMMEDQGAQAPIYVDTSWLLVGHIDETVSFIKANSPRGWAMLVADPAGARKMLLAAQQAGAGKTPMFVGKKNSNGSSAQTTIDAVLADPDIAKTSQQAVADIAGQLEIFKTETGITDAEFVRIPFQFEPVQGYALAFEPGIVNGIYLSDGDFGSPDPHGPVVNGVDLYKSAVDQVLKPRGITTHWIENWDLYHVLSGEVHCGSNTLRVVPSTTKWWASVGG